MIICRNNYRYIQYANVECCCCFFLQLSWKRKCGINKVQFKETYGKKTTRGDAISGLGHYDGLTSLRKMSGYISTFMHH